MHKGLWAAIALVCSVPAYAADYGAPGAEKVATSDIPSGKMVVPEGQGPHPFVVAAHGFSANADNMIGWAQHLGSHGFIVAVPSFPGTLSPDHAKNGEIVEGLVKTGHPKADTSRVGLLGHSAGGLTSTLAAAKMKPRAMVLFDPVDRDDLGKKAMPSVCSPLLEIFAEPGSCNNNAGWAAFKTTSIGPLVHFNVVASTHCDGENSPRGLCGPFCGGAADGKRQSVYAQYATAFFLAYLKDDAAAKAMVAALSDAQIKDTLVRDAPSCTGPNPPPPPADAGTSTPDASGPPSPPKDAGGGSGAQPIAGDDEDPSTPVGSASGCTVGGGTDVVWPLLAAALVAIKSRRRR